MPPGGAGARGDRPDDLLQLLEQINRRLLIELGKPAPRTSHLPSGRAGRCHETHNRLLLDGDTG